jgi:Kdo2-lipid IVA lauroyltransferase/acyltransferase
MRIDGKPKARKKNALKPLRQALETACLRGFLALAGLIPASWHGPLARVMGRLAMICLPLRRKVLRENLKTAFHELDPARRNRLMRGVYGQGILFALELARLRRATPAEVSQAVQGFEGREYLDELFASRRGFLIASAHQGNWEWLGAWTSLNYGNFGVVYKPMHNPRTEEIAQSIRLRFGAKIFSTRQKIPRPLIAHIRSGGAVAILADQDARRQGRPLPFFGRPASTTTALASLAINLRVPILPGFCLRDAPGKFRVIVYPPLWPDLDAEREAEEVRLTLAYLDCVEQVIRRAPEQYFWWHRRWKTRLKTASPDAEIAGPAN